MNQREGGMEEGRDGGRGKELGNHKTIPFTGRAFAVKEVLLQKQSLPLSSLHATNLWSLATTKINYKTCNTIHVP